MPTTEPEVYRSHRWNIKNIADLENSERWTVYAKSVKLPRWEDGKWTEGEIVFYGEEFTTAVLFDFVNFAKDKC